MVRIFRELTKTSWTAAGLGWLAEIIKIALLMQNKVFLWGYWLQHLWLSSVIAAAPHFTDKKIALPLPSCLPSNAVLWVFLTRKANVLPAKLFPGYRSIIEVSPHHSHGNVRDSPVCSRDSLEPEVKF